MRERGPAPQDDPDGNSTADPLDWLYATQWFGMKLGLDSMRRLLRHLDQPDEGLSFLHVGGTNGKGSTCAFSDSIFRHAGYRTGLFTSPHLIDFRERIKVGGQMIPHETLAVHLERIRRLVSRWKPHPTFFEITFAAALLHFQARHCERVVLEVGLGGRLDSTNVVTPAASAIMPVDYDHKRILGNTLGEIAAEKGGIIKPSVPLVLAPQRPAAATVLRRIAKSREAPVHPVVVPWPDAVGLPGDFQRWNAAAAVQATRLCGVELDDAALRQALNTVEWPARFQKVDSGRIVIDGAHNPSAARTLVATWKAEFPGETATALFSAMKDKEWRETLEIVSPIVSEWVFTRLKPVRSLEVEDLMTAKALVEAKGSSAVIVTEPHEALIAARKRAETSGRKLLTTGSLYLAGEVLATLQNKTYQPSEQ